jgi:4,5-dihydroxyphthalate decarboxylase
MPRSSKPVSGRPASSDHAWGGIRKSLVERHPWLAASVFKAFCEAKNLALTQLAEGGALMTSLPWLAAEYEDPVRLMGKDFWS